jgi:arginase
MSVALLGVPSSAGAHHAGQERAPSEFRNAGLVRLLTRAGVPLVDLGDLHSTRFQPDPDHPKAQSLARVRRVVEDVRKSTLEASRKADKLLVLGGDCTLTIGVVAGLLATQPDLGLFYLDGDIDVTTPDTSSSGILDGMGMAHLLGGGAVDLARLGPRFPLLTWDKVVFFGANPDSGWFDPPEQEFIERHPGRVFTAEKVRADPQGAMADAATLLERAAGRFLLHFDVDVIDDDDFPGADTPHKNGLSFRNALATLAVFSANPRCLGVTITEFNPERDANGSLAARLTTAVADSLTSFR